MKASTIIIRLLLTSIPLGIYIASLYQPALLFEHEDSLSGRHLLAWGWWGGNDAQLCMVRQWHIFRFIILLYPRSL